MKFAVFASALALLNSGGEAYNKCINKNHDYGENEPYRRERELSGSRGLYTKDCAKTEVHGDQQARANDAGCYDYRRDRGLYAHSCNGDENEDYRRNRGLYVHSCCAGVDLYNHDPEEAAAGSDSATWYHNHADAAAAAAAEATAAAGNIAAEAGSIAGEAAAKAGDIADEATAAAGNIADEATAAAGNVAGSAAAAAAGAMSGLLNRHAGSGFFHHGGRGYRSLEATTDSDTALNLDLAVTSLAENCENCKIIIYDAGACIEEDLQEAECLCEMSGNGHGSITYTTDADGTASGNQDIDLGLGLDEYINKVIVFHSDDNEAIDFKGGDACGIISWIGGDSEDDGEDSTDGGPEESVEDPEAPEDSNAPAAPEALDADTSTSGAAAKAVAFSLTLAALVQMLLIA